MLHLISVWFSKSYAPQDYRRGDYVFLWLILAVGAALRFWGLGNVGLHGDEETMAMPAMSILETGEPLLPSGMYYARALLNIYMMSGSAWLFGESEWAFRLPSAIVGSFTGLAAFFMGRRFLSPQVNLAFVATVTLLPGMIVISQTARMYVFFVTCILWFGACLFRWERDQRVLSLAFTMMVWLLALHFHQLAIFAAPLFFYPGIVRQSWKQIIYGGVAAATGAAVFNFYSNWISDKYPEFTERPPSIEEVEAMVPLDVLSSGSHWIVTGSLVLLAGLGLAGLYLLARKRDWHIVPPLALVALGLVALVLLQYHLAGLMLLFGMVFWVRSPKLPNLWLVAPLAFAAILAAVQLGTLYQTGEYPGRKLIGAVVGVPSIWPILRFLVYSPVSGVLYVVFAAVALFRFSRGRPLPQQFLFFMIGVWLPLLVLGYFTWYMPPRYALGQLGFFLMCTFAGVAYLLRDVTPMQGDDRMSVSALVVTAVVSVAMINPVALAGSISPQYGTNPDHKGAAEFIRSLDLGPEAILIAEDVLQQTYYLGSVDYSLRPKDDAAVFSFVRDGQVIDQYTGAPVLGSGEELMSVLRASSGQPVYIIGSGENFAGDKRLLRGWGIAEALESDQLDVVYEGRDGKTKVWQLRN